jgi:Saxitoxin biosynthesis operon protein SxtJ
MEVPESEKEMVAGSLDYCADCAGPLDCDWGKFCHCSFHLYAVLMPKTARYKHLETIAVLVLALSVVAWYYKKPWCFAIAGVLAITGLLLPPAARIIHIGWMKLAAAMGFVSSKIILSLVFIIVVVPLGIISRKMGKSSVQLSYRGKSLFITRNHSFAKEDMENPW